MQFPLLSGSMVSVIRLTVAETLIMRSVRQDLAIGWEQRNRRRSSSSDEPTGQPGAFWGGAACVFLGMAALCLVLAGADVALAQGGNVDLQVQSLELQPEEARPGSEVEAVVRFQNSGVNAAQNAVLRIIPGAAWQDTVWEASWVPALAEFEIQSFYQRGLDAQFALENPVALATTSEGTHIYVSTRNGAASLVEFRADYEENGERQLETVTVEPFQALDSSQLPPGVADLVFAPDDQFLYAAAPADNSLHVLSRDSLTGELRSVQRLQDGGADLPLLGVNTLAMSPEGQFLFAASPLQGAITVFRRDEQTGFLEPASVFGAAGKGNNLNDLQALVVGPFGRTLYAASSSHNHIFGFYLDRATGRLNLIQSLDLTRLVEGNPRALREVNSLAISGDGRFIFAGGFASDSLAVFSRRSDSGELSLGHLFTPADLDGEVGNLLDGPAKLVYSEAGNRLYVVSQFANALLEFEPRPNGRLDWRGALRDGAAGVSGMLSPRDLALARKGQVAFIPASQSNALLTFLERPQKLATSGAGPVSAQITIPEGTGIQYRLRAGVATGEVPAEEDPLSPYALSAQIDPGPGQSEIDPTNNTLSRTLKLTTGKGTAELVLEGPETPVNVGEAFSLQMRLKNTAQEDPLLGRLTFQAPDALQGLSWLVQQHPPAGAILETLSQPSNFAERLLASPDGRFLYVLQKDRNDPLTLWHLPGRGDTGTGSSALQATPLAAPQQLADLAFLASGERAAGLAANGREIFLFKRNPYTGVLQVDGQLTEAETGLPQGVGFGGIAMEPNSGSLIIIAKELPSITVMSWIGQDGKPLEVPRIAANLDMRQVTGGEPTNLSDLEFSADGHWLGMAGKNLAGMLLFRRGEQAASLSLQYRITQAINPRQLVFAPHNRHLYALGDSPEEGQPPQLHVWTLPKRYSGGRLLHQSRSLPEGFTHSTTLFHTHNGRLLHAHDVATQKHRVFATQTLSPRLEDLGVGDLQDYEEPLLAVTPLGGAFSDRLCALSAPNPERGVAENLLVMRLASPAKLEPEGSGLEQMVDIPPGGSITCTLGATTRVTTAAEPLSLQGVFQPFGTPGAVSAVENLTLRREASLEGELALISEFAQPTPGRQNTLQLTLRNTSPLPLLDRQLTLLLPEGLGEVSWSAAASPEQGSWHVAREVTLPEPGATVASDAGSPLVLSHDGRHLYTAAADGGLIIIAREPASEILQPPVLLHWQQDLPADAPVSSALAQDPTGHRLIQWIPQPGILRVLARDPVEGRIDLAQSFSLPFLLEEMETAQGLIAPEDFLQDVRSAYLAYSPASEEFLLVKPVDTGKGEPARVLGSLKETAGAGRWMELQLALGNDSRLYSDYLLSGRVPPPAPSTIDAGDNNIRLQLAREGSVLQLLRRVTHEFPAKGQGAPDFPLVLAGESDLVLTLTGAFPAEMTGPVEARAALTGSATPAEQPAPREIAAWQDTLQPQADLAVQLDIPEKVVLDEEFRVKTTVRNEGPSVARGISVLQQGRQGILFLGQEGLEKRGFPVSIPRLDPGEEFAFTTIYSTPLGEGFSRDTSIQQYLLSQTEDPEPGNDQALLRREVLVPLLHQPRPDGSAVVVGQRVVKHLLVTLFEETYSGLTLHTTLSPGLEFEDVYVTGAPAESGGLLRQPFAGDLPQPRIETRGSAADQPQQVLLHFQDFESPTERPYFQRQFVVHLAATVQDVETLNAGNEMEWVSRLEWQELGDLPEIYRTHASATLPLVLHEPDLQAVATVLEPAADGGNRARYRVTLQNADTPFSAKAHNLRLEFAASAPYTWKEAGAGPPDFRELRVAESARLELPQLPPGEEAVFEIDLLLKEEVDAGEAVFGQGKLAFQSLPAGNGAAGPVREYDVAFQSDPFLVDQPQGVLTYYGPKMLATGQPLVYDLVLNLPEAETRDLQITLDLPDYVVFEGARIDPDSLLLEEPVRLLGAPPQIEVAQGQQSLRLDLGTLRLPGNNQPGDNSLVVEIATQLRGQQMPEDRKVVLPQARLSFFANGERVAQPVRLEELDLQLGQPALRVTALGAQSHPSGDPDITNYQILVTNPASESGASLAPAVFSVILPRDRQFLDASVSDGSLTTTREGQRLSLGIDRLLPGESAVVTLQMAPADQQAAAPGKGDLGSAN